MKARNALAVLILTAPIMAQAGALFDGISTRGQMGNGNRALIAGFCIAEWGTQRVVFGALGAETGIRSPTPATMTNVALYNERGYRVAYITNYRDDWSHYDTNNFFRDAGVQMLNGNAAATRTLSRGCYTVAATSANSGTGVVFVSDYYSPKIAGKK